MSDAWAEDVVAPVVADEIDLLLFEVGPSVFGVDASLVLRIDRPTEETHTLADLGKPSHGSRCLVYRGGDGEHQEQSLRVDAVRGVKTVGLNELRRLPEVASSRRYALGVWLDGETPVMLIDLQETFSS
jgi:chemotaxis signal transduction protein